MKQYLLLVNNPALKERGWLPPPEAWPELSERRGEHERLLSVVREKLAELSQLRQKYEAEDAARAVTLEASILSNTKPGKDARDTEEERNTVLADAVLQSEAAHDALQSFLVETIEDIKQRAPEWYATLSSRREEAEAKRIEAQRLLDEADAMVGEMHKMHAWLDRETGRSALGHYPYEHQGAPDVTYFDSTAGAVAGEVATPVAGDVAGAVA